MDYKYYIHKNTFLNDKQGLKPGVRIEKIPSNYKIDFKEGEGPFDDILTLKKRSTIFRNILLRNPKRAQQICLEKNIIEIKDFILTKENFSISTDFINVFEHCIKGKVQRGKVTGVHYYNPEKVKILKLIDVNKSNNVWKAEIEFFDKKAKIWIKKDTPSTFFPPNWSIHQLFHECIYAVDNKEEKIHSNNVFTSKTASGINVEIICYNGKLKSIYPLLE